MKKPYYTIEICNLKASGFGGNHNKFVFEGLKHSELECRVDYFLSAMSGYINWDEYEIREIRDAVKVMPNGEYDVCLETLDLRFGKWMSIKEWKEMA